MLGHQLEKTWAGTLLANHIQSSPTLSQPPQGIMQTPAMTGLRVFTLVLVRSLMDVLVAVAALLLA